VARRLADISALDDASARGFVPELRQQALSTVAVENARGWRIAKEKRGNKIDAIGCIGHGLCLGNPEDLSMSAIGRR
jgi:hypothetical protein